MPPRKPTITQSQKKKKKSTLVCTHPQWRWGGWEVSAGPGEGSGPGARPSSPEEAGGLRVNPFVPGGPGDPASPRTDPHTSSPGQGTKSPSPSCRALGCGMLRHPKTHIHSLDQVTTFHLPWGVGISWVEVTELLINSESCGEVGSHAR